MESESLSMMTMNEMRTLMETLSAIYTDVCLLSADDVNDVREGAYTASSEGKCYACGHKRHFSRHCAAKQALATGEKACRIEVCGTDVLHITVLPYKVEGRSYVLELVQRTPCQDTLDADSGERIMREISGYNTKLYRDALTGAYNRHYYEDVARKAPGPSCVAIMDLDDFKFCNDTYGHHAGDLALEAAANAIRACVRDNDVLIRFGGDEFLLILANMPEKTLKKKLEKIRDQVHAAVIHECPHLRVSVSIGGVTQGEHETMDSAVRRADRLLYHAKTTKNEVVVESDNTLSESVQTKNCVKPLILIVDDCDMNREILREILSSDYSIMEACGGEEALSMIHQFGTGISLVLLDIVMPGLDGFEVLSYMNQDHTIEDIPVIMISSEDSEAFIRRAYEMGASDYVSRPFDAKVVYRRVTNNSGHAGDDLS